MKKLNKILLSVGIVGAAMGFTSCVGDLDLMPTDPNSVVDPSGDIDKVFADIYLNFSTVGPNGSSPVGGFDGGMATWSRAIFIGEEIPTDEASWLWDEANYGRLKYGLVNADTQAMIGLYARMTVNLTLCNQFIQQVQSGYYSYDPSRQADVDEYVRQARILRGAVYFYLCSFYENPPFANETFDVGSNPTQPGRAFVYDYATADLEEVAAWYLQNNPTAKPNYGFVGLDVCEAILAKFYLNGEVFAGRQDYDKCYQHCKSIIGRLGTSGFYGNGLAQSYVSLFGYNNDRYALGKGGPCDEIIWPIVANRDNTTENLTSWAGSTFMIAGWNGTIDGSLATTVGTPTDNPIFDGADLADRLYVDDKGVQRVWQYVPTDELAKKTEDYNGLKEWEKTVGEVIHNVAWSFNPDVKGWNSGEWINATEGWKCMVTRKSFVNKFEWNDLEMSVSPDTRVSNWRTSKYNFTVENVDLEGDSWGNNGYLAMKYTNWAYMDNGAIDYIASAGTPKVACYGGDFAAIRLAEIYLTAAEAILMGGGGSVSEATQYVNYITERAYGNSEHNYAAISLADLRNERARELYTENCRRTDLIRWNQWCTGYTWDWKGGVKTGTSLPEYTKSYPFPTYVITSTGLKQQTGY